MKYTEIQELNTKELKELLADEKIRYTKMKISHVVNALENPLKIRDTRRKIARILTELKKRQINNSL